MTALLTYLVESTLVMCFLYLIYRVVLKNTRNFTWNRYYLLAIYALGFTIPLISLDVYPIVIDNIMVTSTPIDSTLETSGDIVVATQSWSTVKIIFYIYLLGMIGAFLWFTVKIGSLVQLINSNTKLRLANYISVSVPENNGVSSFFHYVFHPSNKTLDKSILKHEEVHIKQKHTFDLLLSELTKIVHWYNPIVYLTHRSIKLNHEYICDEHVANQTGVHHYAQTMSNYILRSSNYRLTSNFSFHLKNRIHMLKYLGNKKSKLQYLLIIPAIICGLALFSFDSYQVDSNNEPLINAADTLPDFENGELMLGKYADAETYWDGQVFYWGNTRFLLNTRHELKNEDMPSLIKQRAGFLAKKGQQEISEVSYEMTIVNKGQDPITQLYNKNHRTLNEEFIGFLKPNGIIYLDNVRLNGEKSPICILVFTD